MPDHDFLFALDIADDDDTGRMLGNLCTAVLGHVGYAAPAIAEVAREVAAALAGGRASGARRCDVRFVARGGEMQVVVACGGAAEWRTTRPLPTG